MAGHPSVKKRQRELLRKERQADKQSKRGERRSKRDDADPNAPVVDDDLAEAVAFAEAIALAGPDTLSQDALEEIRARIEARALAAANEPPAPREVAGAGSAATLAPETK